jgi:hypothetical protein
LWNGTWGRVQNAKAQSFQTTSLRCAQLGVLNFFFDIFSSRIGFLQFVRGYNRKEWKIMYFVCVLVWMEKCEIQSRGYGMGGGFGKNIFIFVHFITREEKNSISEEIGLYECIELRNQRYVCTVGFKY